MTSKLEHTFAPLPNTERGRVTHVSSHPKNTHFVYASGNNIVMRPIEDPRAAEVMQDHAAKATVAKWAPSGYYVASADIRGNVKIWSYGGEERIIKHEHRPISSKILDLAWSSDNQRMIAVGEGSDVLAKAFLVDGGTSVGEVSKHEKSINAVDIKSSRPFRAVTVSEDFTATFFQGPPFKMVHTIRDHSNFVNCVRYSPDGSKFVTVSSDRTGVIYDGKEGQKIATLSSEGAHNGGILSCCFSPDNSKILTVSADRTAKVWDVVEGDSYPCSATFQPSESTDPSAQLVGGCFVGSKVVLVALSGTMYVYDSATTGASMQTITGHTGGVTRLVYDADTQKLYSANKMGGQICVWDTAGCVGIVENSAHQGGVTDISLATGGSANVLLSCGGDGYVRTTDVASRMMRDGGVEIKPQASRVVVSKDGACAYAINGDGISVIVDNAIISSTALKGACSAAISPDGSELAVGSEDKKIYIFTVSGNELTQRAVFERHGADITALAFSHDGKYLASGCSGRELVIWEVATGEMLHKNLKFHNAKIGDVAWSPDNKHVATASSDSNIIVWDIENITKRLQIAGAHKGGAFTCVFMDANRLASGGDDRCVKIWKLDY